MLRYILAPLAAVVLLTASLIPDDAEARVAEVAAIGAVAEPTAAALSQFEDLGAAALSQCAAQAIEATAIGAAIAATGIGATVSVRRRSARRLSARLRRGPTAVAAATTPTATGFARATNRGHPRAMLDLAQVRTLLLAERSRDVGVITEAVDAVLATSPEVSPLDIEMVFRDAGSPAYLISKPELTIVFGMPAWRSALDRLGMSPQENRYALAVTTGHS